MNRRRDLISLKSKRCDFYVIFPNQITAILRFHSETPRDTDAQSHFRVVHVYSVGFICVCARGVWGVLCLFVLMFGYVSRSLWQMVFNLLWPSGLTFFLFADTHSCLFFTSLSVSLCLFSAVICVRVARHHAVFYLLWLTPPAWPCTPDS